MSNKLKKILKIIVILCIIVLVFDIGFLLYNSFLKEKSNLYFDGINSFIKYDKKIIAVGSNSNNDNGFEKAKITLYNQKYKKVWESLHREKYNSSISDVVIDNDKIIVVGSYEANRKEHLNKTRSAFIAKYNKKGKLLSNRRFQILGNSKFTSILNVDDGYIVTGQSIYENMTLGLSNDGGAFLIKYDKELNEIWKKNYGGSKSGIYNDLLIHNDYIYVVGKNYAREGIISKYSLDGELVETNKYDYTDTLGFTGIATDNEYLYVVGSKKVNESESDYDTDGLIIKYNHSLEEIKSKTYSKNGMQRFNKLIVDNNSDIVIAGQTGIYNKEKSSSKKIVFSYDGIFAKYSNDLEEITIKNYGNKEDDYFTSIIEDNNNYIVSGYSTLNGNYISRFIIYNNDGKVRDVY